MAHFLNFGPGLNELPEPWKNLDPSHDIRKRLRFESGSVRAILAEHVVEHVPFLAALDFFGECWRVLEPAGVLRVAVPDASRFLRWRSVAADVRLEANASLARYAEGFGQRPGKTFIRDAPNPERAALRQMLTGWGHQMAWTELSLAAALWVSGFDDVRYRLRNEGQIEGVDGHHRDVGPELAELESTTLEATK